MTENLLFGLAAIIALGIAGQWISWVLKIPSILILLFIGFLIGPITGILQPDEVFGELLFPFVSLSVAIILFEGGLTLKIKELKPVFKIVRNLITIGTVVTWILSSLAAYYFTNLSLGISILLGAILVVTGPTVIMPLLRLVKPKGEINSILKWEGIVNDPIGAMLALLVFDTIIAAGLGEATTSVIFAILKTIFFSTLIGIVGAYLLVFLIKKDFIPDYLQNPATLATLLLVFALSNTIQHESGLFAVTLMGIYLANQKQIVVEHILEFKENLGVLLLSTLFIVLAARLQVEDLEMLDSGTFLFIAILILLIRPATIFSSTIGSKLSWKEKLYLSWMAPRGIVAAAVASIFSLDLARSNYEGAGLLVPIMFLVIISTILIYGLSATPLARLLKLSDPNPQGIVIAGINQLSLAIYKALNKYNIRVLLVDTNWDKVTNARQNGMSTHFGSIVSEKTLTNINLDGIGRFIALTGNKGINSLSSIQFAKIFESANVYQINTAPKFNQDVGKELRGHFFSSDKLIFPDIDKYESTLFVKTNKITAEFTFEDLESKYGTNLFHPLFILDENKKLIIYSEKFSRKPVEGETLISLIYKEIEENNQKKEIKND
ncbi:MAG: hypothetical protein CR986_08270 [Ignavibacteriae bacterium]|nr:MAG: hypothetical protein CR986_08270 [Ignavibacteriota bacterium]